MDNNQRTAEAALAGAEIRQAQKLLDSAVERIRRLRRFHESQEGDVRQHTFLEREVEGPLEKARDSLFPIDTGWSGLR